VPLLASYNALKIQFDWLTDGGISRLVDQNLGRQLNHLELFLRYLLLIRDKKLFYVRNIES
jgi:hypothetical protein